MYTKPKWPLVLIAAFAYVGIITLYGEYVVSRDVDSFLQTICFLGVIVLTGTFAKLLYNYLKEFLNK